MITSTMSPVVDEYPCLMMYVGSKESPPKEGTFIVFMEAAGVGTVLHTEGSHYVGYRSFSWLMRVFTPYTGELVLTNK